MVSERHLRATIGLACAQAVAMCTQVVGHTILLSARAPVNDTGQSRPRT